MAIQIGAKPDSGFDDPIGMLKDCHRRIEKFLGILCAVIDRAQGRGLEEEERNAVVAALQYFRTGGHRHTADEEESLFPRLRTASSGFLGDIERLESDHAKANVLHESVEQLYSAWIENGPLEAEEQLRLLADTQQLTRLYAEHIQVEETIVFALAAQVLDKHALLEIGSEFRLRRK
jgi:hemerythrin-like domain-containing protein